jgi:hypothetical protein
MIAFLYHWLGLDNASGAPYLWWSGFFGDVTILGSVIALYHKHNCHYKGCARIGKHLFDGTPYCSKHHPEGR